MDITYCMTKDCPLKTKCFRHEDNHDLRGQIISISDFGQAYGDPRECNEFYYDLELDKRTKKGYNDINK